MTKNCSIPALLLLLQASAVLAESTDVPVAIPGMTIRAGASSMGIVDTVIFDVSDDEVINDLPVVSDNPISGGFGDFTVQFLMETRPPPGGIGQFSADSAQPMTCISAPTCGTTTIPFTNISWVTRDGDMLELGSSFASVANQLLHTQEEPIVSLGFGTRTRDYAQFTFSNSELRPAGTYRGTVNFYATYP